MVLLVQFGCVKVIPPLDLPLHTELVAGQEGGIKKRECMLSLVCPPR